MKNWSKDELKAVEKEIFSEIAQVLKTGGSYKIKVFGTFLISSHKSKNGVNPRNGNKIIIPARNFVKFNVSKKFRSSLQQISIS